MFGGIRPLTSGHKGVHVATGAGLREVGQAVRADARGRAGQHDAGGVSRNRKAVEGNAEGVGPRWQPVN